MAAAKWHEGRLLGFDTETTGVDVHTDRIVTAAIVHTAPGSRPRTLSWVINPGIDIPTEASDVHGWTNDRLADYLQGAEAVHIINGVTTRIPREAALFEIAGQVASAMGRETPVIAANAAYDFSLLEAELGRHGIGSLSSRPAGVTGVVDPMVLEKQWDPFRKVKGGCRGGKHKCGGCGAENKTLTGLSAHYGVHLGDAHDASADALAAVRVTKRLVTLWPDMARLKLSTLHAKQVEWRRDQMLSLRAYFDKVGTPHDGMCPEWPVHVRCAPSGVAA